MTSPITNTTSTAAAGTTTGVRAPKQTLDGDAFLQLLVTQLRSQDPSSPMDTNQMMAQTTQLSSMEQLTKLSGLGEESLSLQMRMAAATLIGRSVSYPAADGTITTGIASAVSFEQSVPMVTVNGTAVRLDAVSAIASA